MRRFIVLEGLSGAGKSTEVDLLRDHLEARRHSDNLWPDGGQFSKKKSLTS